jgi:hypothetical protein
LNNMRQIMCPYYPYPYLKNIFVDLNPNLNKNNSDPPHCWKHNTGITVFKSTKLSLYVYMDMLKRTVDFFCI